MKLTPDLLLVMKTVSVNVPTMFISIQAVLSLYASGRTTGLVEDIGEDRTLVVNKLKAVSGQRLDEVLGDAECESTSMY